MYLESTLYCDNGKADGYGIVRISEEKAKKMDEWYNKWLKARAAGKYKHLKPEWKWIGDAKEAQKVRLHDHISHLKPNGKKRKAHSS